MCPKQASEKSYQRKPRKGKTNIRSEPRTTLNTSEISTLKDPELDLENSWNLVIIGTTKTYTKYQMINVRERKCASHAKLIFQTKILKLYTSTQRQVYASEFPQIWKKRRTDSYDSTRKKVLLCQKGVPLETTSLFWKGRLFMQRSVSLELSPGHFEYLKQGLHFDMTATLLEQ